MSAPDDHRPSTAPPPSDPPVALRAGAPFGQYRVISPLGQGAVTMSYLAQAANTKRPVVLKVLRPALYGEPRFAEILGDTKAVCRLEHPSIARVYDLVAFEGLHAYVMEYVQGPTLHRVVAHATRLSWPLAVALALQIAEALAYAAQRGVLHRDVRLDNVFVARTGVIRVSEFGLAFDPPADRHPRSDTPGPLRAARNYRSPERNRAQPLDHRSDQFSLGVCLFAMLTGRAPFPGGVGADAVAAADAPGGNPRDLDPAIPVRVSALCRRMLQMVVADRFANYHETVAALRDAVDAHAADDGRRELAGYLSALGVANELGKAAKGAAKKRSPESDIVQQKILVGADHVEKFAISAGGIQGAVISAVESLDPPVSKIQRVEAQKVAAPISSAPPETGPLEFVDESNSSPAVTGAGLAPPPPQVAPGRRVKAPRKVPRAAPGTGVIRPSTDKPSPGGPDPRATPKKKKQPPLQLRKRRRR